MLAKNFTPKIDSARALALYDEGASDLEIAVACHVTASGVGHWRKRHGLARLAHNDNLLSVAQVRQARNLLRGGATLVQAAAHIGVSVPAIQRIRNAMNREDLPQRKSRNAVRASIVANDDLPRRIELAIGLRVPRDIRMDAVNEMYLELLEGRLAIDEIESAAPRFRSRAFNMTGSHFAPRSIDEEDENGFSLASTLADPMSTRPFDEVLERKFANDD